MREHQGHEPAPSDEPTIGRRQLLVRAAGVLAAGSFAQACGVNGPSVSSSRAIESVDGPDPATSTTNPPATSPSTTAATTTDPSTTSTTVRVTESDAGAPQAEAPAPTTSEPGAITEGAVVDEPAERVEVPTPRGAYDREALYVALYGHPGSAGLGSLGEQDPEAGVRRAFAQAAHYEGFGRRVVPSFEIIASVAAANAGADGDYSNEFSLTKFQPHLDAAAANDMHVVCDLQPGRSRFPDQAREYEGLWIVPHVSIALDPEWRVESWQTPAGRIGSVDASEVNETIDYIDGLIRAHGLPPKMCVVHQFTPSMITNKQLIRGTENVQVLIQMDGFGSLELKRGSWGRVVSDLPEGAFTGWKNFYDEDRPTPTASETMANDPAPRYVSFQ